MTLRQVVSSLAISLLIFSLSFAQTPSNQAPAKTEQELEAEKKLEEKGLALLEELTAEAQSLKLPENRLRVLASIADLYWPRDEKRARSLFAEVTQGFSEFTQVGEANSPRSNYIQFARQLRSEVLRLIANHDVKLAREFLAGTRPIFLSLPGAENSAQEAEERLEQDLTMRIAASDPKLALQLGQELLAKGVSSQLLSIISQLQRSDRESAVKLFNDAVRKARSEEIGANRNALSLIISLFRLGSRPPMEVSVVNGQVVTESKGEPLGNDQTLRELSDLIIAQGLKVLASTNPTDQRAMAGARSVLSQLQSVMADIEKYAPGRAQALRARLADFTKLLDPRDRAQQEYRMLMSTGTVEDLLQAAEKAPPERRNQFYQGASQKAAQQGDFERARQIVNDNITDQRARSEMLASLDRQSLMRGSDKIKPEDTRQIFEQLRSDEERANMLAQLATMTFRKGDKKQATQFLEEARALFNRGPETFSQFNAQLQIARAYTQVEPARSFEIIEPMINQLNSLISAAAVLDGFYEQPRQFRDGEFVLSGNFGQIGRLYQQSVRELASLARTDADRAKAIADKFQHNETRVMAHLSIAQGLLSPQRASSSLVFGQR